MPSWSRRTDDSSLFFTSHSPSIRASCMSDVHDPMFTASSSSPAVRETQMASLEEAGGQGYFHASTPRTTLNAPEENRLRPSSRGIDIIERGMKNGKMEQGVCGTENETTVPRTFRTRFDKFCAVTLQQTRRRQNSGHTRRSHPTTKTVRGTECGHRRRGIRFIAQW